MTVIENLLLTFSDARAGTGYLLFNIFSVWPVSVGSPSISHRGSPPSRTLELLWPNVRNMNSARGAEKTPWESYLVTTTHNSSLVIKHRSYKITWDFGVIPKFSRITSFGDSVLSPRADVPRASLNTCALGIICLRPSSLGAATSSRSR